MEIFVQARKDGYNVLFPKPTPKEFYKFASDLQSASAKNDSKYYGKNFYSLAFADGGFIFTKYVIGYDIQRNNIGNVGISVFIPVAQKLSGNDVKKLLDELISVYCQNYCVDNKITNKREDWQLLTSVLKKYEVLPGDNLNDSLITVGSKEPAFHYYKNDSELIELFGNPFQEEYAGFKQVFFIDNQLKDTANPLDVIKNSGVEVNPDLKNKYYYLHKYNFSKKVIITANGKPRSDKKHENQIRAKWQVEINYSKNPKCYEPIIARGTLSNQDSEIYKYLKITGTQILIDYGAFDNPPEKSKELNFEIKDWKGNNIKGAEIIVGTRSPEKAEDSIKTIAFQGEEIIQEWKVSAEKKSEELYSDKISIKPYTQTGSKVLSMHKQKVVEIFATDEGSENSISNFKVRLNDGNGYRTSDSKITFLNDDIDKTWNIEVSKKEGQFRYLGKKEYRPASGENPLYIQCEKKVEQNNFDKTFKIDAGEHGEKTSHCPAYSNSSTGDDLRHHYIKPNKGYVFTGNWELQNETLVAQYVKRKSFALNAKTFLSKSSVIASLIVSVIVLVLAFFLVRYFMEKDTKNASMLNAIQINEYILGDSLMLDKLYAYKENWKTQEGDAEVLERLKQAIEKRAKIDSKQFFELKYDDFKKSEQQRIFINSILKIDSTEFERINSHLGDISSLTLTQIIDSINVVVAHKSEEVPAYQLQVQEEKLNKEEKNKSQNDEPEYITNYLETSSGFELSTINQYHSVKGLSNDLNKSLVLVKNFINGKYKNCDTFKGKALKDKFLKNNPNLESWVEEVCEDIKNVTNSTNNSENIDNNEQEFIKAFWDIVYSNKPSKQDFDNWFKTGRGIAYDNAYKVFYDKHLSTSMKFNKSIDFFKRPALERKRVKTLDDLKKEIQ